MNIVSFPNNVLKKRKRLHSCRVSNDVYAERIELDDILLMDIGLSVLNQLVILRQLYQGHRVMFMQLTYGLKSLKQLG